MKRFLLCVVVGLFACNSSHESTASGEVASMTFGQDPAAAAIARSAPFKQAQAAIDQGHPWRATQLMAPVLRDPRQRTPAALLVAARAAAGWGGWPEVEKLIAKERVARHPVRRRGARASRAVGARARRGHRGASARRGRASRCQERAGARRSADAACARARAQQHVRQRGGGVYARRGNASSGSRLALSSRGGQRG